jgi:hypothetical protein
MHIPPDYLAKHLSEPFLIKVVYFYTLPLLHILIRFKEVENNLATYCRVFLLVSSAVLLFYHAVLPPLPQTASAHNK